MPSQESSQARSHAKPGVPYRHEVKLRLPTVISYRIYLAPPWVSLPTISVAPSVPLDVPPDVPLDVPLDVPAGMVHRTPSRVKLRAELSFGYIGDGQTII